MYYQVEYEDYDGTRVNVLAKSQEEVVLLLNALDYITQTLQRVTPLYIDLEVEEVLEQANNGLELG